MSLTRVEPLSFNHDDVTSPLAVIKSKQSLNYLSCHPKSYLYHLIINDSHSVAFEASSISAVAKLKNSFPFTVIAE